MDVKIDVKLCNKDKSLKYYKVYYTFGFPNILSEGSSKGRFFFFENICMWGVNSLSLGTEATTLELLVPSLGLSTSLLPGSFA